MVDLKDEFKVKSRDEPAQLACEAAGAIRTVASLAREDDCCRIYNQGLTESLRKSKRSAVASHLLFAISQSMTFWVIALVFWWGSLLVSRLEIDIFQFFVCLMVSFCEHFLGYGLMMHAEPRA